MRAILIPIHAAVTHFKHVRIVPVTGARILGQPRLCETDQRHSFIRVLDVASSAPKITADLRPPLPHTVHAILAKAVDDWTPSSYERVVHLPIGLFLQRECRGDVAMTFLAQYVAITTKVVLKEVDAPLGIG